MKLILTSDGLITDPIIKGFESLCGKDRKDISLAIINEAYAVEVHQHRWVIDELSSLSKVVGGEIRLVNLLALDKEQILESIQPKDAIFVMGGHTDYLMHVFNKTGFVQMLPDLLKEKVYAGASAGSMVMAKRISTEAYDEVYGERGAYGTTKYMEFVGFAIKPHLNSQLFPKNRKEVLEKVSASYNGVIYALQDDQAISVNEGNIAFIGGNPLSLQKGKII